MTLPDLQAQAVSLLRQDSWLKNAGVEIVAEDKGDIAAEVERALAGIGSCVVAMVGEFRPAEQDGALSGIATLLLQTVELPAVNRRDGHQSALAIANRLAEISSSWGGARCSGLRLVEAGDDALAYEVSVEIATTLNT